MIDAIYFPFTHMLEKVLNALETCFRPVVLLPSCEPVTDDALLKRAAEGRLELRSAGLQYAESVKAILKNYQNWAALHRDEQGLRAAYFQSLRGQPPLYDENATSRIRESIQSRIRAKPKTDDGSARQNDKLLQASVFLSMAQQFDSQNTEMNAELKVLDAMEHKLFAQLHGETPSADAEHHRSSLAHGDPRLDHMIPERLASWSLLFAETLHRSGSDHIPIMITDSGAAVEHLIGLAPEAEQVIVDLPLPDNLPQEQEAMRWRSELNAILEKLAVNPWPAATRPIAQWASGQSAAGQWCLNGYLVPGQTPRAVFGRCCNGENGPIHSDRAPGSILNTVICLIQKTL